MAKEKEKLVDTKEKSASSVRMEEVLPKDGEQPSDSGFWKSEIEVLQGKSFESMDEAIGAVVEAALNRLGPDINVEDVRQFVFDMFDSDPALKEELNSYLDIK